MKIDLTDDAIQTIKPKEKRAIYRSSVIRGLILRVEETGSKVFYYQYKAQGRKHYIKIGTFPEVKLQAAERAVERYAQERASGRDPAMDRRLIRESVDAALKARATRRTARARTFAKLVEDYRRLKMTKFLPRTQEGWNAMLDAENNGILKTWGDRPITKEYFESKDIAGWLHSLADEKTGKGRGRANKAHVIMSAIFRWGARTEHSPINPMLPVDKPFEEGGHKRQYTEAEIRKMLRWTMRQNILVRTIWRLFFWTLSRRTPVCNMRWSEIDWKNNVWTFEDKGSRHDHKKKVRIVPFSRQAVEALRVLKPITGHNEFVFETGRQRSETNPFREHFALARSISTLRKQTGIKDARPHGIRGTMTTVLQDEEFADDNLVARVLGHVIPKNGATGAPAVTFKHYALAGRINEQRKALQNLADWLDAVEAGKAVDKPLVRAV